MDGKFGGVGGTWQRYKLGQAQFTTWLKQTAEKVKNSKANENGEAEAQTKEDTPRGPSRREKKRAKANGETNNEVVVHWRELEGMADTIVENARPEDIPTTPINILRDVVGLRKRSARFFSRMSKESDDEKLRERNATHEHIIKVLERVLGKFESVLSRVKGTEPIRKSTGRMDVNDLNNMFEYLDIQASSEEAEEEEDASISDTESHISQASRRTKKSGKKGKKAGKGPKARNANVTTPRQPERAATSGPSWIDRFDWGIPEDKDDDEFDMYMMVYCFFEDFNAVRAHVCERWCDYYFDRSVPLDTLAVITNAAFELFQQMDNNVVYALRKIDRRIANYQFMMYFLFTEYGMEHIDYESYENLTEEEQDERMWKDEADWLAMPAYQSVEQILEFIPPGKVPMVKPSDRRPIKYGGTTVEELNDFKQRVISDLMYDVTILKAMKKNGQIDPILPAESELLLLFEGALETRQYSSAFIFALQLYVDIRYIMEDSVSDGFTQLQETAHHAKGVLDSHLDQAIGPRRDVKRMIKDRQHEVEVLMLNDILYEDKIRRYRLGGIEEETERFSLFKCDPVFAGLVDFRAKVAMSELGHEFTSRSLIVEAAAHVYYAARAAAATPEEVPRWPEMEKFLASYGDDSQFKQGILEDGGDPLAILGNYEKVARALSSADASSQGMSKIDGESFNQSVSIRQCLYQRYASHPANREVFMMYIQEIIGHRLHLDLEAFGSREHQKALMEAKKKEMGAVPLGYNRPIVKQNGSSSSSAAGNGVMQIDATVEEELRRRAMRAQITPIEMLQILEEAVTHQLEGLLALDYFKLYDESLALLRTVNQAFGSAFQERVGFTVGDNVLPDQLARVAVMLAEDVKETPRREETLATLVGVVKEALKEA
ncbi:hypothetical protein NKR23_g4206 [Pleurostoma richardsiae]|uniref:DUF6604 domain-containing protein n=1 Tax=Pleurostoma richardsiae TaxID=41990 RepID=A0AA38RIK1_9PEZI|nr:hypothetical protein NKR23_g4206 [Pleurostoma richardsiae]